MIPALKCVIIQDFATCQHLLVVVQCNMSGLSGPDESKSRVLYQNLIREGIYNLHLSISGDSPFKFLGIPNPAAAKPLHDSLNIMLTASDSIPLTCHQKSRLYKQGVLSSSHVAALCRGFSHLRLSPAYGYTVSQEVVWINCLGQLTQQPCSFLPIEVY